MNKNFWLPKLNVYSRKLSMWQDKLWHTLMDRPYSERGNGDDFIFCNEVYGMTSNHITRFKPTVEPHPVTTHQMAVSSFPYGIMAAAGAGATPNLDTTVTVGSESYDIDGDTSGPTTTAFVYGFKAASSYHPLLSFAESPGSIANATYTDGGSTSQTVTSINWSDNGIPGTPAAETDNIYFGLDGLSRGDDDGTFSSFEYNGVEYVRSTRDSYANYTAETFWRWDNVTTNGPTSGTVDFLIYCS